MLPAKSIKKRKINAVKGKGLDDVEGGGGGVSQ